MQSFIGARYFTYYYKWMTTVDTSGFLYLERSPKLFLSLIYRKFGKFGKSPDQEVEV